MLGFLSPLTQKRLRIFLGLRRAKVGLVIFGVIFILSMFAELWSNNVPIFMWRDQKLYVPMVKQYPAEEFGIQDAFIVNYFELVKKDLAESKGTVALFPANKWDAFSQTSDIMAPPSAEHWLGTDGLGRDVTARLLYGMRVSLTYGLLYWIFSFVIGIFIGSIQGFYGGRIDFVTERGKELGEIIPFLPTVIIVNGLMHSQSMWVTLFVVVIFAWMSVSSQIRAQFLSLRRRDFTEAARAIGSGDLRIIWFHVLPNALAPVMTLTPFAIASGISILAILDYLGFGMNPPTPSIGELLQQGRAYIANAPWLIESATVALCFILISINLIGEALRQAFDPKAN